MRSPTRIVAARKQVVVGVILSVGAALVAGCGLQSASGKVLVAEPGSIKHYDSLEGVELTVGSKEFTEQIILGNMIATILATAGAEITNQSNTPGSIAVRKGTESGRVDISPEYTGTGWINYLGHAKPVVGVKAQYEAVRKEDLEQNEIDWLPPAPMNNTYAFAMGPAAADELGITKLSELKDLPKDELTFCVESEFAKRNDGFQPMLEAYGLSDTTIGEVTNLDTGTIYSATAEGGTCNFGEVFTTDGRIPGLDLKVLQDDKHFFPQYNMTEMVRHEVLEEHPEIKEIFAQVNPKITNKVMLRLNAKVDVDGEDPAQVALDWLKDEGFVK